MDSFQNRIINGDCIDVMKQMPESCIDLVVTDPPYLVNYRSRDGRTILNDVSDDWLVPSFRQIFRVLKNNSFCISFYGWNQIDRFMNAWKQIGFQPVEHIVFKKNYASSRHFCRRHHECAFVLAKGNPVKPKKLLPDVLHWEYSGNKMHPTQKPICAISPLITGFSKQGDVVLDPFCGSGTTLVSANDNERNFIGIEKDKTYWRIAQNRLQQDDWPF